MNHIFFKRINIFLFVLFLFSAVFPSFTFAQIDFGGRVLMWNPICMTPPGVWLTIGPPRPMPLFSFNAYTFAFGPPSHPGQAILGKAGAAWVPCIIWVPCVVGTCPVVIGGGFPILFNGSSP